MSTKTKDLIRVSLASAFQIFKQFGNRLARPVSMVYNGDANGRRSVGATFAEF